MKCEHRRNYILGESSQTYVGLQLYNTKNLDMPFFFPTALLAKGPGQHTWPGYEGVGGGLKHTFRRKIPLNR